MALATPTMRRSLFYETQLLGAPALLGLVWPTPPLFAVAIGLRRHLQPADPTRPDA